MTPTLWFVVILYVAASGGVFAITFSRRYRTRRVMRFARSVGLTLPTELERTVGARLIRRQRGGAIGWLIGTLAMAGVVWSGALPDQGEFTSILFIGTLFCGMAVGAALTSALHDPSDDPAVRYARSRSVALEDYIAPIERNGARTAVGIAVALLLVESALRISGLPLPLAGPIFPLSWLLTALAVLALGFFELVGRRILARGRVAGSPDDLAWDDALRSLVVRDLVAAPLALGLFGVAYGSVGALNAVSGWLGRDTSLIFVNVGVNVLVIAIAGLALFAIASEPQRYFLRRLWPEVAAGAKAVVTP